MRLQHERIALPFCLLITTDATRDTPEHLEPLSRVLKSGAIFRVATDIPDYVRQTLEQVPQFGFEWLAEGPGDWRDPWGDWISTRYEQKAFREGRKPHYLTFRKV